MRVSGAFEAPDLHPTSSLCQRDTQEAPLMVGSAVGHPSSPKAAPAPPRTPQDLLWPLLAHGAESPMGG